MKNISKVLLYVIILSVLFLAIPNYIYAKPSLQEIQDELFTIETPEPLKSFYYWTSAYYTADVTLATEPEVHPFKVKRNPGYEDAVITDKNRNQLKVGEMVEVFEFKTGNTAASNIALDHFATLNVEKDNIITCGEKKQNEEPIGYTNCRGNDYCNYFCSRVLDEIELEIPAAERTVAYYIYGTKTPDEFWDCDPANPMINGAQCIANQAFTGENKFIVSKDDEKKAFFATTSIQARSYKAYKSKLPSYEMSVKYMGTKKENGITWDHFERKTIPKTIEGGMPYKVDDLKMPDRAFKKTIYYDTKNKTKTFTQSSLTAYSTPIKFKYYYATTKTETCTVSENVDTPNLGKDCSDIDYTEKDKYKCVYNDGKTIDFDTIPDKSGNTESINPYCYKSCKTKLAGRNFGSVSNNNKPYQAGMGFDWKFNLSYDKDCTVTILLDKYKNATDSQKYADLSECYRSVANSTQNLVVNVSNFKYGEKKYNLDLKPSNSTNAKSDTVCKDKNEMTRPCNIITHRTNYITKISYSNNVVDKTEYTTDEFGCILKGSGLAVKCAGLQEGYIQNKTTYPIAFEQHPAKNVPITLEINFGNKKIIRICKYDITNSLFGKEDDPVDCNKDKDCDKKKSEGIDVIYRPIQLTNPFPSVAGTNQYSAIKLTGDNWTTADVSRLILNNRNVKSTAVYGKEPLYRIELNPVTISKIRIENNKINSLGYKTSYNDFELKCDNNGFRCQINDDNILNKLGSDKYSGTCVSTSRNKFYTCADKKASDSGEG